ncbi:tudor domain-containing protein 15, partial [Centroberyx affinis]|uniref:tudor domain-containing protein 15 n=1 Tax=Centroberyx affinis TaxID=166261 RepID=UPI003A5C1CD0
MKSRLGSEHQKSQDPGPSAPCALWPVDLKLTHLDWSPEATLIHFQGQYLSICELDYNIVQGEIQNTPKTKTAVDIGEFCLVEDLTSARWYRGRVQNRKNDLFDVFLIDHGNVLSVDIAHLSSCSNDLFILPPKIVCGFLANVLSLQDCWDSVVQQYFSSLIGRNVTGYLHALLPHKVLILEAPDVNNDLIRLGFGRHVDTDTFLLLVEMLTEVPLKQNIEPVPDLLIEKPRGQEFCFKPTSLQGFEDILSFCGPRLIAGTRVTVRVTAAVNPGLFYCQMTSVETALEALSEKLATACESRTKDPRQKPPENLGLLCSVKGKDEKWYRGFVQFLPVNSQVRVLFVDYGFCESVKVENVHWLPPDFHSTPIMAFPCSLSSVTDQDEAAKTQQLSFLKKGLLRGVLDVEIRSFDEEQNLYTITVLGAKDSHVKEPEPIQELPKMKIETVFETEQMPPQGGYLYYETVMAQALGETLEAENVQVDSVFVGYVEHVLNPNHFWIRTQKRNHDFEEMMKEMADHFSQVKLDEEVLTNPEVGTLCCAMYEKDMHYYRGVVTDTLEHGAEVFFIDFGNIEKVPHMLIKEIPERFASEPAFAFCCTLVNVVPVCDVWTSASADLFRQAVSNKALRSHVVHLRKHKFVVDLYEMGSDNNHSITELLISSNQAEYWNNIPSELVMQNKKNVTEKTDRQAQWEDCKQKNEKSTEVKAEILQGENTQKNETEKAQAPLKFKAFNFKPGCEFAVHCSHVNSPSDFWCQLLTMVPALEELMDKIQQYYTTHTVPVQLGVSCCVAKSPEDGRWYRACITGQQKGYVNVILVDYGMFVQLKEHNLQTILPEYVELEGQAFRCSLYNLIEPVDPKSCGVWNTSVCNSLKDFVRDNSSLRCSVVSQLHVRNKGLCNVVDLYNTQTQQSITNMLVEQGLAREVQISTKLLSTVCPESFIYSSFKLSTGSEEQVYITHVSSPWEVFCHLDRNCELIEELEKKVSVESEKMMQANTRAVVGKLCLAKYFDGKWYRGFARPVQSPLHLAVFFVDYGNVSISEKTNVMCIPMDSADLLYTPMQAVRCSLAGVPKEELCAEGKQWLDETILNKEVRAVIVGKSEDGSLVIELFDGDVYINEKVKELILSLKPKPKLVVSVDTDRHTNVKTSVKDYNNHPKRRPSSYSPKSNALKRSHVRNARNSKQNERKCVPMKTEENRKAKQQMEHHDTNNVSEQPPHTHEMPKLSCLPDKKVSAGFRAKCYASHIDSVNSFFLQMQEDEPAILKMGQDLNSDLCRDSLTKTTPVDLRINDLVLAEYEEDTALYRSVVKGYEGSGSFKVEFVDYGNSAVVGKEKLYSITREHLSQPRFSIPCSLDTSTYKTDACFTDAVMEKPLMVDFVSQFGTQWKVKIEIPAFPVAPEATVESSDVTEKEEEAPALPMRSSEMEEALTPCEQSSFTVKEGANQTRTESEGVVSTAKSEKLMLKSPPTTSSTKHELKTCKHYHSRKASGDTDYSPKIPDEPSKTSNSPVEATHDPGGITVPPIIQARETETGTLLSVLCNGDFYMRLNKTTDLFAALESLIAENLYKCEVVAEEEVKEGLRCLTKVQGVNQWHRAVVQHVHQGKCQVFLVDHGITEEMTIGSLRGLCINLTEVPSLAVLCRLNNLGFTVGEDAHRLWQEALRPMIGSDVKLLFVSYSKADNLWLVEIVMNGLFLIPKRIATLQQRAEDMTPLPTEAQNARADGETTSDPSPPRRLFFAPVHMDKAYSGFAAAVTTPFEFRVALEDLLLIMHTVSIMLDDVPGETPPLPEAQLVPGSCCLVKSDAKNKWCRAEVAHADDRVVVNLVDYGHCVAVAYEDRAELKRLPEALMRLPKVTYPCVLRGVKPIQADGQWTDEAAVFFQERLYQKNLQIFFREFVSDAHWEVDLLADGVHVAKELVDARHANYIDVMLGLRYDHQPASCIHFQAKDIELSLKPGTFTSHRFLEQSPCEVLPRHRTSEEDYSQKEADDSVTRDSNETSDLSAEATDSTVNSQ